MENKNMILMGFIVVVVAIAGYFFYQQQQYLGVTQEPAADQYLFDVMQQNESGQSGQIIFAADDETGNTIVTVSVDGGEYDQPQPAHIHVGNCPDVGTVRYPLENVVDGESRTMLDVPYATLVEDLQAGAYAVNIHQSVDQISVYTACGDVF